MIRHAVILAGGSGSRLWPISRSSKPKQFQKLLGKKTLVQQTYDRVRKLVSSQNIWLVTGAKYGDIARKQLPKIPSENIILEPTAKNTAPAIMLASLKINAKDPQSIVGVFPSDHRIGNEKEFESSADCLFQFVGKNPSFIGLLGIKPTQPDTGLGYIKIGDRIKKIGSHTVFKVSSFHEKPDQKTAQRFFESWEYLWNGGYFFFEVNKMLKRFEQLTKNELMTIKNYLKTESVDFFNNMPDCQMDKAVIEKINQLAVVPADLDWSDLGNWQSLHQSINNNENITVTRAKSGVDIGSKNCLVISGKRFVATVGLENTVIVDTNEALLVCHHSKAHDVKKVVDKLIKDKMDHLV